MQTLILFSFLCPIFFQLSSGSIFVSEDLNFDTQGSLLLLPLPLASVFCFIGIAILLRLEKRHFGMGFVFSIFILMMLSTIVSTGGDEKKDLAKFILLIQFILPMFALVLGSLYVAPKSDYLRFEAVALYVLWLIVPLEVISTFFKGTGLLSPDIFFFSLYQHLLYLPVIFVGLYFLSVNFLYKNNKLQYLVTFLAPWMGVYVSASLSMMSIILAVVATFISGWLLIKNGKKGYIILLILLFWASFTLYYPVAQSTSTYASKYSHEIQKDNGTQQESNRASIMTVLPHSLKERLPHWEFYGEGVFKSPKIFLFGHTSRPDRTIYPSAHNYYLDLVYHFGVISILPFIYLIFVTMRNSRRIITAGMLTPSLAMSITVVSFFVFADNSLKVSFRQPYPGMIMFFIWGVLLTKISIVNDKPREKILD